MKLHQQISDVGVIRIAQIPALEQTRRVEEAVARRAYEIFEQRGGVGRHELEDWRAAESDVRSNSCFGLTSSEDSLLIGSKIVGFEKDSVEIWVDSRQITICGKPIREGIRSSTAHSYRGHVFRVVALPVEIDASRAFAGTRQHGLLDVHLPIAEQRNRARVA